nr:Transmembrane protein [Ipomoea batatas]GME11197.1 Transmembrane protein [Ipomoea batatas]
MDRHCSNYAVVLFVILVSLIADGRELRPSEHGLGNQDSSSGNTSEMHTFFGGSPESSELPEARNFTASLWNGVAGGKSFGGSLRDGKKDDAIREALFVASMVCGLTGVVLVVASAFLLIFRLRKRKSETTSLSEANVAQK